MRLKSRPEVWLIVDIALADPEHPDQKCFDSFGPPTASPSLSAIWIAAVRVLVKQDVAQALRLMAGEFCPCGDSCRLSLPKHGRRPDAALGPRLRGLCPSCKTCVSEWSGHDQVSGDSANAGANDIAYQPGHIDRSQNRIPGR